MRAPIFHVAGLVAVLFAVIAPAWAQDLIFTAPPRDSDQSETNIYEPVAEYLSGVIGKKIVFEHADNWLSYQDRMQKGHYDLVFDGPHFLSWRMVKLGHEPLVAVPGKLAFTVIARKDDDKITSMKSLCGRMVCGMAPPNLATLTMYAQFDNPTRQPLIVEQQSFKMIYDSVVSGKCAGGALRDAVYKKLDKDQNAVKVLYQSPGVPNQAFSASPRFTDEDKAKMIEALLAPEAKVRIAKFLAQFGKDVALVKAQRSDFEGVAVLLKDTYGFDLGSPTPGLKTGR